MQQDRFFGLQGYPADSVYIDLGEVDGEPFGYWETNGWATQLVEIQPFTAEIDPILDMPEVESVIAGASCFDSDSGRYHFLAFGGTGVTRLVGLDMTGRSCRSGSGTGLRAFAEIEYCIPTGQIVGRWRDLSENGVMRLAHPWIRSSGFHGGPASGLLTSDGSVFDQNTNSYVLHYYDASVNPICLRWTS